MFQKTIFLLKWDRKPLSLQQNEASNSDPEVGVEYLEEAVVSTTVVARPIDTLGKTSRSALASSCWLYDMVIILLARFLTSFQCCWQMTSKCARLYQLFQVGRKGGKATTNYTSHAIDLARQELLLSLDTHYNGSMSGQRNG